MAKYYTKINSCNSFDEIKAVKDEISKEISSIRKEYNRLKSEYDELKSKNTSKIEINRIVNEMNSIVNLNKMMNEFIRRIDLSLNIKNTKSTHINMTLPTISKSKKEEKQEEKVESKGYVSSYKDKDIKRFDEINNEICNMKERYFKMNQYGPEAVNLRKRIYDWCKKRETVVQTVCGFVLEIKNAIIDTVTISGHGSTIGKTNFTSTDKLYLLAPKEIYTDWSDSYDTAKDLTRTLDYYTAQGVTISSYSGAIKKNGTSASRRWWLRSAVSCYSDNIYRVGSNGGWGNFSASSTYGVSPAFRIG